MEVNVKTAGRGLDLVFNVFNYLPQTVLGLVDTTDKSVLNSKAYSEKKKFQINTLLQCNVTVMQAPTVHLENLESSDFMVEISELCF